MRLLLLEDDNIQRELLTLLLAAVAPQITPAATLAEALALPPHDVILTDLHLPDAGDEDIVPSLRRYAPVARLIGMSASAPEEGVLRELDAFLLKPFTPADFLAALTRTAAATTSSLDEATFRKLSTMLPTAKLHELYEMSFTDAEQRLARMQTAAADGDLARFRAEAHALKGSAGMLGATELHALAVRMETSSGEGGAATDTSALAEFRLALDRLRRILATHP